MKKYTWPILILSAFCLAGVWGKSKHTNLVVPFTRHIQLPAQLAGTPANQPTEGADETAACLIMANSATEYIYATFEIGEEWKGREDMTAEVDWVPYSGAVGAGQTVQWDWTMRSVAIGEALDNGTAATMSGTFTDGGSGTSQYVEVHTGATIDWDHANQPLVHEDHVFLRVERNNSDTFSGTVCVTAIEIIYTATGIPEAN